MLFPIILQLCFLRTVSDHPIQDHRSCLTSYIKSLKGCQMLDRGGYLSMCVGVSYKYVAVSWGWGKCSDNRRSQAPESATHRGPRTHCAGDDSDSAPKKINVFFRFALEVPSSSARVRLGVVSRRSSGIVSIIHLPCSHSEFSERYRSSHSTRLRWFPHHIIA